MAPLYQRYIPGAAVASQSSVGKVVIEAVQDESSDVGRKRKREPAQDKKTSRKAQRVREELAGSQDDVDGEIHSHEDITTPIEAPEPTTSARTGEFAHIKSSKKRHKLEKEARKARKQSERGDQEAETVSGAVARPSAEKTAEDLTTDLLTTRDAVPVESSPLQTKRQKRQKQHNRDEEVNHLEDDDDPARLKKHAALLGKFEKAQKHAAHAIEQQASEDVSEIKLPSAITTIDPLVPIEVDTSMPDVEPGFSTLPFWITSAKRAIYTEPASFKSLKLESDVLERLRALGFDTALPVQRSLLPILLPVGTPGAYYRRGTETLLPDIAVSAPTGSGKTLAYMLPIIAALKQQDSTTATMRALIIVPTRELVAQVAILAEALAKGGSLKIGTASGAGKLKDEQQKVVTTSHVYAPAEYNDLYKLAQLVEYPPSEDSPDFDDYVQTIHGLNENKHREIEGITSCPIDHIKAYKSGVDILICTPGRLLEHLDNTIGFELSHVQWLILDEADKLLDEQYDGFLERLHLELETPRKESQQGAREQLLRKTQLWDESNERRVRKVVLSATMTRDVSQLTALKLRRPQLIVIGTQHDDKQTEDDTAAKENGHTFDLPLQLREYCVPAGDGNAKPLYLLQLLEHRVLEPAVVAEDSTASESDSDTSTSDSESEMSESDTEMSSAASESANSHSSAAYGTEETNEDTKKTIMSAPQAPTVLIFVASTEAALRLSYLLKHMRPQLASNLITLSKSTAMLNVTAKTRTNQPCIVIATDRAGRGLDIISGRRISHVVQYDVPRSIVSYVHRVGRTARAGHSGQAWTLYTNAEARWFVNEITKAPSIQRSAPVERVRFKVDDGDQEELFKEVLAGMKNVVFNSSRHTRT